MSANEASNSSPRQTAAEGGDVAPRRYAVPASIETVRQRIARHPYQPITDNEQELGAAVLVPLYQLRGVLHIILTKRTTFVSKQQGHISFPGGRRDPEDKDLLTTALRESCEEIGLDPRHVDVFGRIDDFSTRDGETLIAGFVGLIDPAASPYAWRPAEREVAELLEVPVSHLIDPANVEVSEPRELNGRMWPNEVFVFRGHRTFGATARALRHVLDIAFRAEAPAEHG